MENWDFSVLTGASLNLQLKIKDTLIFSGVSICFQDWCQSRLKVPSNTISMSNSLDLDDNQHFASLIRV